MKCALGTFSIVKKNQTLLAYLCRFDASLSFRYLKCGIEKRRKSFVLCIKSMNCVAALEIGNCRKDVVVASCFLISVDLDRHYIASINNLLAAMSRSFTALNLR